MLGLSSNQLWMVLIRTRGEVDEGEGEGMREWGRGWEWEGVGREGK